jgi:hypothetical protein
MSYPRDFMPKRAKPLLLLAKEQSSAGGSPSKRLYATYEGSHLLGHAPIVAKDIDYRADSRNYEGNAADYNWRSLNSGDLPGFHFISFTEPGHMKHRRTKKTIRSYVMRRFKESSRPEREIVKHSVKLPHPNYLGSGRSNPFTKYPIEMDLRAHELFDYCKFKTRREASSL